MSLLMYRIRNTHKHVCITIIMNDAIEVTHVIYHISCHVVRIKSDKADTQCCQ